MPSYIRAAWKEFGHNTPSQQQDTLYPSAPIKYGKKIQYAELDDDSVPLDKGKNTSFNV